MQIEIKNIYIFFLIISTLLLENYEDGNDDLIYEIELLRIGLKEG